MKDYTILKKGRDLDVLYLFCCEFCGCEFVISEKEALNRKYITEYELRSVYGLKCPHCESYLQTNSVRVSKEDILSQYGLKDLDDNGEDSEDKD